MTDTKLEKIESAINKEIVASVPVSGGVAGIQFSGMGEVLEFAKLMALSSKAVPPYLRGDPGACLAVSLQALGWRMDPFAVANKSYFVNDRIAFEAQLIQAVIEQRAPISTRIQGEYSGEGDDRVLRVWAMLNGGDIVDYTSPPLHKIRKKSPLWKDDPDQQIWYYATRALCRRHFPDVILGVYSDDEMNEIRDITPKQSFSERLAAANAAPSDETEPQPQDVGKLENLATGPENGDLVTNSDEIKDKLEANTQSPLFAAGANCFTDNIPVAECPFEIGTQEAADWMGGYYGAKTANDG